MLYLFYDEVIIYKPLTSRVANSEKYIICKNFKGCLYVNELKELIKEFENFDNKNIDLIGIKLPNSFIILLNGLL